MNDQKGYGIMYAFCPACDNTIILKREGLVNYTNEGEDVLFNIDKEELLYPKGYCRPVEKEVPKEYADEYREAAEVRSISPKASAAISRRLLQNLLREVCKMKQTSLAKEIDQFINDSGTPEYLANAVDAIRNIGNFAAHPIKDTSTGEIVEVEDGEADWLLDVLDSMFDYLFVQPKRLDERKNKLNDKLKSLGKPPMKDVRKS